VQQPLQGVQIPKTSREILAECHRRTREVVESHGGFLVKILFDGAHFLFGYPQAHEDDAERAVRAGLAVTRAVRDLRFECLAEALHARVGLSTGVVVISDPMGLGMRADELVVGEAPVLASFLLGLADPSAVMISASTRRLIGGLFEHRDLGAVQVNHLPDPVEVSEVLRESAIGSRLEALRSVSGELVGRGEELDLLLLRWQQAKLGEGRVVLLSGEAGIGKSRLARALQEHLSEEEHTLLIYHCSPYHQVSALHPTSIIAPPRVLLVWNTTASVPVGLYVVKHRMPKRGDLLVMQLPPKIEKLAVSRAMLSPKAPV
jgi:class 3 adenylate cyclase